MYDPHDIPPSSFEPQPPPEGQGSNRRTLLLAALAGVGTLLFLLAGCVVVTLVVLPDLPARMRVLFAQPLEPPPPMSPRNDELEQPVGPVDIDEDFAEPTPRWDQSSAQVIDGAYELHLDTPNSDSYGLFLGSGSIQNFDIAVDVQQVAGDRTAEYGIRFRQSGPGDYLMFSISGTGYYRLVRVRDSEYESLVPWTFDGRIKTGSEAVNRLHVVAEGSSLTASVNGSQVVAISDEVNAAGQLTLGLVTFDQGGLEVRFDTIEGSAEGMVAGQVGDFDLYADFSDPEAVPWSLGGSRIINGSYEIFAGGGIQSWQHPLPSGSSEVQNFVVEVDATLLDAGPTSSYGIIFADGGSFDFYSLFLLPEGGITLVRQDDSGSAVLLEPMPLPAVEPGINATNTIRLEVRESSILIISINGEELPPLESARPIERGMVGLIVSSGAPGRVQVRFDNFHLEELFEGDEA